LEEAVIIADETGFGNMYSDLPPRIDLSRTVGSVDVTGADVEHGGRGDDSNGADPYLRVTGWKRP
jgi:hypothetical protein